MMLVEDVNDTSIRAATILLCRADGTDEFGYPARDYAEAAVSHFRTALLRHDAYPNGIRMCLFGWPHVKWRYRVRDDLDGTPFERRSFTFVLYLNCTDITRPALAQQAHAAAAQLRAAGFPVVVEE